jgi:hypothetical protein
MNCQKFEDVVSELARGQMMEAELRNSALVHSDECLNCRRRLADEQSLTRGLLALSMKMESLRASRDSELRLLAAMNREQRVPPTVRVVSKANRKYWLAVAAALLLFVASAIAITWQQQSKSRETTAEVNPVPNSNPKKTDAPVNPQEVAVNGPKDESNVKPRKVQPRKAQPRSLAQARSGRKGTEVVSNHAREVATDFMPLGFVNSANLQDGGHIVRVELPRSALVSFGLPVNMDRVNEKVKADVWFGVDGLARAIRFVQ